MDYSISLDHPTNLVFIECYICLEKINQNSTKINLENSTKINLECGCPNSYHKECLDQWYAQSKKCPICKEKINDDYLYDDYLYDDYLYDDYFSDDYNNLSTNLELYKTAKKIIIIYIIIICIIVAYYVYLYV